MKTKLITLLGKPISDATNREIYVALLTLSKELANKNPTNTKERKVYYFSAEFLIGKLLSNNLINLGVYDEIDEALKEAGKNLADIEEVEPEPSLGNGGLGRLAACFLDSIANLDLNGDGVGLNYHFGLFKQQFIDNKQFEVKNEWIEDKSWLTETDFSCDVPFRNFTLKAKMYDIDVCGGKTVSNKLHLFDAASIDESIVGEGISFDKNDIAKNITLFLYPDDSDRAGHLLRIYQQYFLVSCGARLVLKELEERGLSYNDLDKYVAIQINDTHPSMVIPELIRILMEKGIDINHAAEIVSRTCAYTNHTILAEALEKWPLDYLEEVVPTLVPIIKHLDWMMHSKYHNNDLKIIDEHNRVHMARMDMHFGFSINGVAALHTEILKTSELKPFYDIYPEKFNNKTNGVTFRRWLKDCNKPLTAWLEEKLGNDDFLHFNPEELRNLIAITSETSSEKEFVEIKHQSKIELKNYLKSHYDIEVNENSIFDIQVKRLHEYKRQQLNLLYLINKYFEIKGGKIPKTPITAIFGAKAAPAYTIAKDIIHAIICLGKVIDADPEVSKHLKVIMVENYNVTFAEKLIPACDVSEQISLASKEASGTGNMKFMLNGAVTLGTLDGANVEIAELVGEENIYVFGKSSDEVIDLYKYSNYHSAGYYWGDDRIKNSVDFLMNELMLAHGNHDMLARLHHELINKDWFMTLLDFNDYVSVKDKCFEDYADRESWGKKMIVNTAMAGFFSSDRTIAQYNQDIWRL